MEKFLYVNETLRQQNVDTILSVPNDTIGKLMWEGRFKRLSGAANRAGFADGRIYKYQGREVDRAVHLGMDLASTSNAKVGAANNGRAAFLFPEGVTSPCKGIPPWMINRSILISYLVVLGLNHRVTGSFDCKFSRFAALCRLATISSKPLLPKITAHSPGGISENVFAKGRNRPLASSI